MDVHRCRFVHYPPSTINALAFSHSHISEDQKTASPRLAVGRANGDIEIWNPLKGSWLHENTIRGGKDRTIDDLVWTQDPNEEVQENTIIGKSRLFSIGCTTTVTEWNLEKGQPLRSASGNHGEIFCLAAQPPYLPTGKHVPSEWQGQYLVAGCADGALVLYSTKDDDLQIQKVFMRPSKKANIVSVAFQGRNIVVAGCSDGFIRIFDIRSGLMVRSMSLGAGPIGGHKNTIVWAVRALKDGTIVSGDSTGELRIWDGKTYTLKQRIKGHRGDVYSLTTSHDGSTVMSGGSDRRTVVYRPVGKGKARWAEFSHRRYHKHDVKALATFEGKGISVIVSGGPDAAPVVLPLSRYGFEYQRALPFLPQDPVIQSAPRKRLMMGWWQREIHIWRLGKFSKAANNSDKHDEETTRNRKLVAKILIKGDANVTSASLSADGDLLAVATVDDIKLFQLHAKRPEEGDGLRIAKVSTPSAFSSGARLVQFSPDSKWLSIVRSDSQVATARILSSSNSSASSNITIHPRLSKHTRIDRHIEKLVLLGGLGSYDRTVTQIAFSVDSRILAISDLAGYIDTFVLRGEEDLNDEPPVDSDAASSSDSDSESGSDEEDDEDFPSSKAAPKPTCGQQWTRNPSGSQLPKLPSTPVVLSFRPATESESTAKALANGTRLHATRHNPFPIPTSEDRLLVITASSDIFEFEVLQGRLSPWSRRNPTSVFPEEFRNTLDQTRGCVWDISQSKERVWLHGIAWMWMFDLSKDFSTPPATSLMKGTSGSSKKRKRKAKDLASGAGTAIPDSELGTGISRKMQRLVHEEENQTHDLFTDKDGMDLDSDDDQFASLERLRHENSKSKAESRIEGGDNSWHTFKYRPILGVVVIGEGEGDGLEVAVVERPIWECDVGPRLYGDQEWEKPGLNSL